MQTGQIISGSIHVGLLVLAAIGAIDTPARIPDTFAVADVTMISAEMLEVQSSAPPQVSDTPDQQAAPEPVTEQPPAPAADTAPEANIAEAFEEPQVPDVAADLTPVRRQPSVQTPVSMDTPVFEQPQTEATPEMPQVSFDGNERNTTVTALSPPPPRAAPRIDTTPAEAPPPAAEVGPAVEPETTTETGSETPEPEVPVTAPPEATTEIQPEAQSDAEISAAAPEVSSMPVRRPRNMAAAAQAVEAAAEVSRRVAEEARVAAAQAAEDAALAEEASAIEAALAAAAEEVSSSSQDATLTGPEAGAIAGGVAANWNKQLILEQPNYEQYIVRVAVTLDGSGKIVGAIEPVSPSAPDGYFRIAFDTAERAIRLAAPIQLPTDRFPDGATLILTFNPVLGVGFN